MKFPISYISLCVNFAFILNTLHCDAYWRDGGVKFKLDSKSCILMQLFEVTCIRNFLIVKNLEHRKFQECPTWKRKDCSICSLHSKNDVMFTLTIQNRAVNFRDKHPKSKSCRLLFRWCCFRAYRLITMEWNVKRIVPCKRWENFLSATYLCVLTLLLF